VLDGVLIGAGDGRFLAWAGLVVLGGYAPLVLATAVVADDWVGGGLPWLWVVFGVVFMGGRFLTLTLRAAGDRWLVTGAGT
jgi:hypothetical protein